MARTGRGWRRCPKEADTAIQVESAEPELGAASKTNRSFSTDFRNTPVCNTVNQMPFDNGLCTYSCHSCMERRGKQKPSMAFAGAS